MYEKMYTLVYTMDEKRWSRDNLSDCGETNDERSEIFTLINNINV